ncbi:hypothetical protein K470DRAFT_264032 [Piedraia hortae CBS 480.64]|uniref:Uncharacterized protein n=1 Tax=Piedraia hortae CBS 480.64 TaxID=1314780 RepID=A0A6A7C0P0_9PEZI|nr:hypothetical protein K470DRAFT_264032 [Piedraia hortae CBS 480.64]
MSDAPCFTLPPVLRVSIIFNCKLKEAVNAVDHAPTPRWYFCTTKHSDIAVDSRISAIAPYFAKVQTKHGKSRMNLGKLRTFRKLLSTNASNLRGWPRSATPVLKYRGCGRVEAGRGCDLMPVAPRTMSSELEAASEKVGNTSPGDSDNAMRGPCRPVHSGRSCDTCACLGCVWGRLLFIEATPLRCCRATALLHINTVFPHQYDDDPLPEPGIAPVDGVTSAFLC